MNWLNKFGNISFPLRCRVMHRLVKATSYTQPPPEGAKPRFVQVRGKESQSIHDAVEEKLRSPHLRPPPPPPPPPPLLEYREADQRIEREETPARLHVSTETTSG
ncbi:unnamed protein product [Boreogadus saida]